MQWMDRVTGLTEKLLQGEPDRPLGRLLGPVRRFGGLALVNRMVGVAVPFATRNGFTVEALEKGYIKARIPIRRNRNHMGTLYAGAQFLVAEIPGGVMAIFEFGSDYIPILESLNMTYIAPARTDVTVAFSLPPEEIRRIQEEADANGRSRFVLEGELKDEEGQVVARSSAHYQVKRRD